VLHNVTYDGRNTFYRLSFSEMTVPYGGMFITLPLNDHI
jgi:Cu2+-containing amine oxidase